MFRWPNEYLYFDFAKSFIRTGVTCLLPAPTLDLGLKTPLYPFSVEVWLLVIAMLLLSIVTIYILGLGKQKLCNKKCYKVTFPQASYIMYSIFIQQSLPPKYINTNSRSLKILLGIMCLYCILVSTSYSSGLASNLAIPRYTDAIDTVEQFAESNVGWAETHAGAWIASLEKDDEDLYQRIVNKFIQTNISHVKQLINSHESGIPIERLPSGYYAISKFISLDEVEKLRPLVVDLYFELTVIMTRKSSILLPSLDEHILQVFETGLPLYWEAQVARKYLNMSVQLAIKNSIEREKSGPKSTGKLAYHHISGALLVWGIGMLIATLCFVYENICRDKKEK